MTAAMNRTQLRCTRCFVFFLWRSAPWLKGSSGIPDGHRQRREPRRSRFQFGESEGESTPHRRPGYDWQLVSEARSRARASRSASMWTGTRAPARSRAGWCSGEIGRGGHFCEAGASRSGGALTFNHTREGPNRPSSTFGSRSVAGMDPSCLSTPDPSPTRSISW